jgi:hypothetical protein
MKPVQLAIAQSAKQHLAESLAGKTWVRGIGISPLKAGYGLRLNVDPASAPDELPASFEGVPVEIVRIAGYSPR